MKTLYSISILVAAAVLFAFSMPVPAFSQMQDMSMEQSAGPGQMMEMGDMNRMGEMAAATVSANPSVKEGGARLLVPEIPCFEASACRAMRLRAT